MSLAELLYALKLRACDAHAAVWQASKLTPEKALEALQDEGFVHQAIHDILKIPIPPEMEHELLRHIEKQDQRIDRLEAQLRESEEAPCKCSNRLH